MIKKKLFVKKIFKSHVEHKRPFVNAYNEKCFWVHNGPVLSNLKDLARALDSMTDKQYSYHVGKDKNDFAMWVEFVLQDKECAGLLSSAGSREKAASIVQRGLKKYLI
jgi:hypothetical protein